MLDPLARPLVPGRRRAAGLELELELENRYLRQENESRQAIGRIVGESRRRAGERPGGAAETLGIKPTTLRSRMERKGLDPRRGRRHRPPA